MRKDSQPLSTSPTDQVLSNPSQYYLKPHCLTCYARLRHIRKHYNKAKKKSNTWFIFHLHANKEQCMTYKPRERLYVSRLIIMVLLCKLTAWVYSFCSESILCVCHVWRNGTIWNLPPNACFITKFMMMAFYSCLLQPNITFRLSFSSSPLSPDLQCETDNYLIAKNLFV